MNDGTGVQLEDLPELLYDDFVQALYVIRAEHDPAEDWPGFVRALWPQMVALFDAYEVAGEQRIPPGVDEERVLRSPWDEPN